MRSSLLLSAFALATLFASGCTNLDPCTRGTLGCACLENVSPLEGCEDSLVCAQGTCRDPGTPDGPTVCHNACAYRGDGHCDDGVAGSSEDGFCAFGTDCSDCGLRTNPCAGSANPVYCPQTPNNCWPAATNCLTVRFCTGESAPFGCSNGQAVDCSLAGSNRCVATTTCVSNGLTPCIGESACVAPFIDCNSLTDCGGTKVGCFTGETVMCSPSPTCIPPP